MFPSSIGKFTTGYLGVLLRVGKLGTKLLDGCLETCNFFALKTETDWQCLNQVPQRRTMLPLRIGKFTAGFLDVLLRIGKLGMELLDGCLQFFHLNLITEN